MKSRAQLSLYLPHDSAKTIEDVRSVVDPVQRNLIAAHVTLCREDELGDLAVLKTRLVNIPFGPLQLGFGKPEIFSGHGLLLPCIEGEDVFRALREYLLGSKNLRLQSAHITLAHPRNAKAPGNSLAEASRLSGVIRIAFPTISLIEQVGDAVWELREVFPLAAVASAQR